MTVGKETSSIPLQRDLPDPAAESERSVNNHAINSKPGRHRRRPRLRRRNRRPRDGHSAHPRLSNARRASQVNSPAHQGYDFYGSAELPARPENDFLSRIISMSGDIIEVLGRRSGIIGPMSARTTTAKPRRKANTTAPSESNGARPARPDTDTESSARPSCRQPRWRPRMGRTGRSHLRIPRADVRSGRPVKNHRVPARHGYPVSSL